MYKSFLLNYFNKLLANCWGADWKIINHCSKIMSVKSCTYLLRKSDFNPLFIYLFLISHEDYSNYNQKVLVSTTFYVVYDFCNFKQKRKLFRLWNILQHIQNNERKLRSLFFGKRWCLSKQFGKLIWQLNFGNYRLFEYLNYFLNWNIRITFWNPQ